MILTDLWIAFAGLIVGALGLIVSLCGFTIAVWQIRRTRTAAEHAEEAATAARQAVLRGISISDLTQAYIIIEELRGLHRNQDLDNVLQKYGQLMDILFEVRANLSQDYWNRFDEAIDAVIDMEEKVETATFSNEPAEVDTAGFNRSLRNMQSMLRGVRADLEGYTTILSDIGD